jgi:hypothetical protein
MPVAGAVIASYFDNRLTVAQFWNLPGSIKRLIGENAYAFPQVTLLSLSQMSLLVFSPMTLLAFCNDPVVSL